MRTNSSVVDRYNFQRGVSLIELVIFLVVVSIATSALLATYANSAKNNADPIIKVRALELAQARLDEILALKYDANTPTGGIPACNSTGTGAMTCNNSPDSDLNDVDDFHNVSDTPYTGYTRDVTVVTSNNLKLVTVTVTAPKNITLTLAAYRANF
ncbi:MSHA biogenesis protein MshD [Cellvibrio zantedeschiae]|uniref:MSHA biogenesis protein MshD n=1 Tax=Cellvibrio zantedeschiae TaxID=1237077 RepID=A0ABQ3AW02_9GAMM|nr:type II secretion system protein [Cellvibrio zantedeschiae]GGY67928.1 MSHA biogenesis protein MshD [Cellvibrio zantedeschiae]